MKIRCGSHQQNRSIVRPGLSLMATKVALTAEEFRENSQRSIALFNTEKLSTDSTHVLKSAYCILCISAVAICTERVEAKISALSIIRHPPVAICTERVEAKIIAQRYIPCQYRCNLHGACGGKGPVIDATTVLAELQSARSVWRQRTAYTCLSHSPELQSARDVWKVVQYPSTKNPRKFMQTYCIFIHLGV